MYKLVSTAPRCLVAYPHVAKQSANVTTPRNTKWMITSGCARSFRSGLNPVTAITGRRNSRPYPNVRLVVWSGLYPKVPIFPSMTQ